MERVAVAQRFARLILAAGVLSFAASASDAPRFGCHTSNANPRHLELTCTAVNHGSIVPEWRLFGDTEEALLEFHEGKVFRFEVPNQWRLLEMRLEDSQGRRRWRVWIRAAAGVVESRAWGSESE